MEKEIKIMAKSPIDCTDEQFIEWVEYSVGYRGGISFGNPLHDEPFEAIEVDIY